MSLKADVVFKNSESLIKVSVPKDGGGFCGFLRFRSSFRVILDLLSLGEFLFALVTATLVILLQFADAGELEGLHSVEILLHTLTLLSKEFAAVNTLS